MLDRVSEYMADKISEQMPWERLKKVILFNLSMALQGNPKMVIFYVWDNPMLVSPVSFEENDIPSARRCKLGNKLSRTLNRTESDSKLADGEGVTS